MTDVIQLLPDSVANQIAAGEVIQRPASVIKELVENAVDAGAHTINVLVVDAGRTSIQVIDDGCGMSETDARLAFERHATSKIRKADDLFSLHTMGFRGEALPSIAAVAQIELRTRRESDELGTCLTLSASHIETQEVCSCAVGCSFTVSNLFFNVPARRKFLKTNATELNNILTAFERIVLVYPNICFTLHSNGQELMNLKAGSLRQRITDVYGRRYGQDLLPLQGGEQGGAGELRPLRYGPRRSPGPQKEAEPVSKQGLRLRGALAVRLLPGLSAAVPALELDAHADDHPDPGGGASHRGPGAGGPEPSERLAGAAPAGDAAGRRTELFGE